MIEKGAVIEQGSHVQLLGQKGVYANLVKRQLLLTDSSWATTDRKSPVRQDLSPLNSCVDGQRKRTSSRNSSGSSVISKDGFVSREKVSFTVGSV